MEIGKTDLASESAVINEDEEFYENLEAPKYLDLTAPDPLRYEDGSWFCVKIGCDQNHEHVDPEALQKSFMLRVMAARSPNVRLHKALKHRSNLKCPHSAPAKQPRSRLFKLSTATEIPDKIENSKFKNHPISNLKKHPISNLKSPSPIQFKKKPEEKAFTTPKSQTKNLKFQNSKIPNSKIQNSKIQNSNGSVFFSAKIKFSSSPKKEIKEVCAKMRKLNLNNLQGAKRKSVPSRYLARNSKPTKDLKKENEENLKNEEKSKIVLEKKSLRPLWKLKKPNLKQDEENSGSKVKDLSKNQEFEKDLKNKKKTSLRPLRKSIKPNLEENKKKEKLEENKKKEKLEENKKKEKLEENKNKEKLEENKNKEKLEENINKENSNGNKISLVPNLVDNKNREILKNEICMVPNDTITGTEREESLKNEKINENLNVQNVANKENVLDNSVKMDENKNLSAENVAKDDSEGCDENKENVLDKSAKRDENENVQIKNKTNENLPPQKVGKIEKKKLQVKTTNPKPFRFRTDERGILKEANIEKKKLNELEPQKEMTILPLDRKEIKNKVKKENGVKKVVLNKIKNQMIENQIEKIAEKSNKNTRLASLATKKEKNEANLKRDLKEKGSKIVIKKSRINDLSVPKYCTKKAEMSIN